MPPAAGLLDLLKNNGRIQSACKNSPPIRKGEGNTAAVCLVQKALVGVGYPMPGSTKSSGEMDGIFGTETDTVVRKFQSSKSLGSDGVLGTNTLAALFDAVAKFAAGVAAGVDTINKSSILQVALKEMGVSWKSNPARVKDYFRLSAELGKTKTGKVVASPDAVLRLEEKDHVTSWCSFFVHWVLHKAGGNPLPPKSHLDVGNSVSRFVDLYITGAGKKTTDFAPGVYEPKPGDMYSMPFSPLAKDPTKPTNHIGFVFGRETPGDPKSGVVTIDGNSITPTTQALWLGGKGGGMVCRNVRDEKRWISFYIPQPPTIDPAIGF